MAKTTRQWCAIFAALLGLVIVAPAGAFQIGVLGPKLEARLTNEPDASLLRAARNLGKLLKSPVHEEIAQIAFDCPADLQDLSNDDACAGADAGYVDPFVVYGLRWNDVPPFRLSPGQGSKCRKLGVLSTPACRTDQTVRFSTQPDCWLCLFFDAEAVASQVKITGCQRGDGYMQGNLITRSHFGDLQFLHSMADDEGIDASVTRAKLIDWAQFAWRVFDGDFQADTQLKSIPIPTIQQHFGCSEWTVADLYVLGATPALKKRLGDIAFGSLMHTVQDSFAAGHVERESPAGNRNCSAVPGAPAPGAILEFHAYGAQDGHKHDHDDARAAFVAEASSSVGVVAMMRQMFEYYRDDAKWRDVEPFFQCVFALGTGSRASSAGAKYLRLE